MNHVKNKQAFPQQMAWSLQPAHMSSQIPGDMPGMTLREYFASQALIGFATQYLELLDRDEKSIAQRAVAMADALCEELAKP